MKKRLLSSFMALLLMISCFTINMPVLMADSLLKVHVIVENMVYPDGGFYGVACDEEVSVPAGSSMMDAIAKGLEQGSCLAEGISSNYISSIIDKFGNELSAGDGSSFAGWMGSLNDWFTNVGFGSVSISDGDDIRVMYTMEMGKDIGADFMETSTELIDLQVEGGTLSDTFQPDTTEYSLDVAKDTTEIQIMPTAKNKNFQVRIKACGKEYNRKSSIPVENGMKIEVTCGEPSWPGSLSTNVATTYELTVNKEEVIETEGATADPSLGKEYQIHFDHDDNGSVIVDKTFAKFGETVTFLVAPKEGYEIGAISAKDKDGNPIELKSGEEEGAYSFLMPKKEVEVSVSSVAASVYKVKLYSVPKSVNRFYNVRVEKEDGTVIPYTKLPKNVTQPYEFEATKGTYYYVFTNELGEVTLKNTFEVEDTEDTSMVQNVYLVELNFTFQTSQLMDEKNEYYHGGTMKLVDNTGKEVPCSTAVVSDGKEPYLGYEKYYYVVQAKGEDYKYSYYVKMCDDNLQIQNGTGEKSFKEKRTTQRQSVTFKATKRENPAIYFHVTKGAGFGLYKKTGVHYTKFTELTADSIDTISSSEYDTYTYSFPIDTSTTFHAVAGGSEGNSDYMKTVQIFHGPKEKEFYFDLEKLDNSLRKGCSYSIEYANKAEKTVTPLYETTEDDLFLNVDDSNYLMMKSGETFDLHGYRVNQAQKGATENYFIEPDFHYDILSGNSVEIEKTGEPGYEYATLKAVSSGITVIRVRYDAMNFASSNDSKAEFAYYNATDPQNERIVIVNVDGSQGSIQPNIAQTEYDTIFYTRQTIMPDNKVVAGDDFATYRFRPVSNGEINVSVHKPIHMESWDGGWQTYKPSSDGYYTIRLYGGENIVKMQTKDGVSFYTISAAPVTVHIDNQSHPGANLQIGDVAQISFESLKLPNKKMAGIYNPGFPDTTWTHYDCDDRQVTQKDILKKQKVKEGMVRNAGGQYVIASKLCNLISFKILDSGTIRLTNGRIHSEHFGSALNAHRLLDERGTAANLNASNNIKNAEFSTLPDITLVIPEDSKQQEKNEKLMKEIDSIYENAGSFIKNNTVNPGISSIGGEWAVIGLARGNQWVPQSLYDTYLSNVIATLKEKKGVLSTSKYTEYSRVILALTAIGVDVTNVGGYNLLTNLTSMENVCRQGINGPIWALIALDSKNYEIPMNKSGGTQVTRDRLIQTILDNEVSGGGFSLTGDKADADITAMCIQAFAPYYKSGYSDSLISAVDRSLNVLSDMQSANGEFSTYGVENCESNAQVLVALSSLGIDPVSDKRFVKQGNSVLTAISRYVADGGGFRHIQSGDRDGMATEQAYYALTAYYRMKDGSRGLYDMKDVSIVEPYIHAQKLIDEIPSILTLLDLGAVEAARACYDSLSPEQKSKISSDRVMKLENAENVIKQLLRVDNVEQLIQRIGKVTLESKDAITAARRAFDKLTSQEKEQVKNIQTLILAEEKWNQLQEDYLKERTLAKKKQKKNVKSKVPKEKDTRVKDNTKPIKLEKMSLKQNVASADSMSSDNRTIDWNTKNVSGNEKSRKETKEKPLKPENEVAMRKQIIVEQDDSAQEMTQGILGGEEEGKDGEKGDGERETTLSNVIPQKTNSKSMPIRIWIVVGSLGSVTLLGTGTVLYWDRRKQKIKK